MRADGNIFLHFTEKEHSFISNIAGQCASSGNPEMSEIAILRVLVRLLQKLEIDPSGVKTEDQLLQRLQDAARGNQELAF